MKGNWGVLRSAAVWVLLPVLAACASMDPERAAFGSLMRLQCEDIQARGTCNRSFSAEFDKWQDDRAAYIAELEEARSKAPLWPGIVDTSGLPELSH